MESPLSREELIKKIEAKENVSKVETVMDMFMNARSYMHSFKTWKLNNCRINGFFG